MCKSSTKNMVIFVFVVDTSASMNQRTSIGTTLLDVAKNAVETFTKLRQRDQASRTDRYMLVTLEEPPGAIKAGWRENQVTFMNELKNLQATGLSTLGTSLKEAFDLLNLYRLHSGIDNYGMGRNPFYVEPAMVICITDGCKLSGQGGIQDELHLPMHTMLPGHELTTEPFRWDQRLFSIILRMPGTRSSMPGKIGVQSNEPAIAAMCEVTGGRCYKVMSSKSLGQALESLVQKVQCGVVINFEKIGGANNPPPPPPEVAKNNIMEARETGSPTPPLLMHNHVMNNVDYAKDEIKDKNSFNNEENHVKIEGSLARCQQAGDSIAPAPSNSLQPDDALGSMGMTRSTTSSPVPPSVQSTAWMSCRRMIYIKSSPPSGHWPVPESFWPDPSIQTLPSRDAHPSVLFSCNNSEPLVLDNLPFDKYELEPSPLTQYILERKSPSNCWQTFILNSCKKVGDMGFPFGYLKASSNLQTVNLFVMPYNFPVLFPIVDELVKVHKMKPTAKWKEKFDGYLSTMPSYYAGPLRNAFRRMGIPHTIVPDQLDSFLSYTVVNYLKKVKQQSKMETDRLISLVGKNPAAREAVQRPLSVPTPHLPKTKKQDFRKLLHNNNYTSSIDDNRVSSETDINIPNASSHNIKQKVRTQSYKNPFDISREELLDQVSRMRINFFHTAATSTRLQDEDARHSVAIADMGNYQEVLRQMSPLREVDPGQNRVHMFGNPFKLAKDQRVMVDEADVNEAMAGPPSRKRPPMDNRPGSPRDRRRPQETPPVRWPNKMNQNGGPITGPINNKVQPDKNASNQDVKVNNVYPGHHGVKRKHSEGSDGVHKTRKSSKGLIDPQLARLQRLQNKGRLNRKHQPVARDDVVNSSKNDFVSSILKEAVTSQTRTFSGQGVPLLNSNDNALHKNKLTNSEAPEVFVDEDVKERGKGPSPRLLKKQLEREAMEENRLIRNRIFKEIRQPEKSDEAILDRVGNLKGSLEVQTSVVQEIIEEAELFKKRALIEKLSTHLAHLQERLSPNSDEIEISKKR